MLSVFQVAPVTIPGGPSAQPPPAKEVLENPQASPQGTVRSPLAKRAISQHTSKGRERLWA